MDQRCGERPHVVCACLIRLGKLPESNAKFTRVRVCRASWRVAPASRSGSPASPLPPQSSLSGSNVPEKRIQTAFWCTV